MSDQLAENTQIAGGLGGPVQPGTARDTRLAERAVRQRWPIPDEKRGAIINRLCDIALDKKTREREAISAAKAIISADRQNQIDERPRIETPYQSDDQGGETPSAGGNVMNVVFVNDWHPKPHAIEEGGDDASDDG